MKLLLHFIFAFIVVSNVSAQSPDTMQRVKMIRHYYNPNTAYGDSIVFVYSGNRGSIFNLLAYEYDYGYLTTTNIQGYLAEYPEPFVNRSLLNVLYDTAVSYRIANSVPAGIKFYNIYSGDKVAVHYLQYLSGLKRTYKLVRNIDQQGNVNTMTSMYIDSAGAKWDSTNRYISYHANGNLKVDTLVYSNTSWVVSSYVYNSNGQITMYEDHIFSNGTYTPNKRYTYMYDATDKVVQRMYEQYQSNTTRWDTIVNNHVRYDDLGRLKGVVMRHKPSMWSGDSTIEFTLHYKGASSQKSDTMIKYGYDLGAITQCAKSVFYYNEYGNPDSVINYIFSGCTQFATKGAKTLYKYELYTEEKDTTITPQPKGKLIVFPNPASDVIKIRWNEDKPTAAYLYMYNSIGQLVGSTYIAKPEEEDSITLPGLAAGVYYIRINTGGGGRLYSGGITIH